MECSAEEVDAFRAFFPLATTFFPTRGLVENPEKAFKLDEGNVEEAGALAAWPEWYGLLAKAALASSEPD